MTKIAFLFAGQGAQKLGMASDLYGKYPIVRETFEQASSILGYDIHELINNEEDKLNQTRYTQPAILTTSVAIFRLLQEKGYRPDMVAGLSLGEYSALVAAGSLTLAQAAPLVRFRAAAMQEAVPVGAGAMAAILGLDATTVRDVCTQSNTNDGEIAEAVNFNDPAQTVIAGTRIGVERACEALKAAGAKRALMLPVSAPFHSSLMKPAADKLRQRLAETSFAAPQIPVINNIDVAEQADPEKIRDALYRQAFGPVRWVECVQAIVARGVGAGQQRRPGAGRR